MADGSSALAKRETAHALIAREAIEQAEEQRSLLKTFVERVMVEETDFGVIPGTKKKSLYKAGSEKLFDLFRVEPEYDITHRVDDWAAGLFAYEFRCVAKHRETGAVFSVGYGSCSTYEGKYRWRDTKRRCPACDSEAIIKSSDFKTKKPDGYLCWPKRGGCNAKFPLGAPEIEEQKLGREQNPDIYDQRNTVLKMAKKRAGVDAAIALARCSDIFTQDVEDIEDLDRRREAAEQGDKPADKADTPQQQKRSEPPPPPSEPTPDADYVFKSGDRKGKSIRDPGACPTEWLRKLITQQEHPVPAKLRDAAKAELKRRQLAGSSNLEADLRASVEANERIKAMSRPDPSDKNERWGLTDEPANDQGGATDAEWQDPGPPDGLPTGAP